MTMSFKDWYDSKSEDTKAFIRGECKRWVSPLNKDYYYPQVNLDKPEDVINFNCDDSGDKYAYAAALIMKQGGTVDDVIKYFDEKASRIYYDAIRIFSVEDRKKIAKAMVEKYKDRQFYSNVSFSDWLFIQDDYSNLDLTNLRSGLPINNITLEILGKDKTIEYAKSHPEEIDCTIFPEDGSSSEIFDTLFFGENGWTEEQKEKVVNNIVRCRPNSSYMRVNNTTLQEKAALFMKNVCSVDKRYLEYFYKIIRDHSELARYLYEQKKPAEELTGNETVEMTYRYPKWLRKLFLIMGCCARKNVSMANADKLKKEGVALLKLYNYDFHQYFTGYLAQNPDY